MNQYKPKKRMPERQITIRNSVTTRVAAWIVVFALLLGNSAWADTYLFVGFTEKNKIESTDLQNPEEQNLEGQNPEEQNLEGQNSEEQGIETQSPGILSAEGDGYVVTVQISEEAGLPDDVQLKVSEIEAGSDLYNEYLDMTRYSISSESGVAFARFFDVDLYTHTDSENGVEEEILEPSSGVTVSIEYDTPEESNVGSSEDVPAELSVETSEVNVMAIADGNVEMVPDVEMNMSALKTFSRDTTEVSFAASTASVFGVVYTVDYEYNGYTYHMPGGMAMLLSELLDNLHADFGVDDVTDVTFSSPELLYAAPAEEKHDWVLVSLRPFNTREALTLMLRDGSQVIIDVTDDKTVPAEAQNLTPFLTKVEFYETANQETVYKGGSDDPAVLRKSREYDLTLVFAETEADQFINQGVMWYYLPDNISLGDSIQTDTFAIDLGRGNKLEGNTATYVPAEGDVPAHIEVQWNVPTDTDSADFKNYTRLISSEETTFTLHYTGATITDYDEIVFSDDVSVFVQEDEGFRVELDKTGIYDATNKWAAYTVEITADGNARNFSMTDTLGAALDYIMADPGEGMEENIVSIDSITYRHGSTELDPAKYSSGNITVEPCADQEGHPASSFTVQVGELADGDTAVLTYRARVDFDKLTKDGIKEQTTNSVSAVTSTETSEDSTSLEKQLNYLSIVKKNGVKVGQTEDGKLIVQWEITYNMERNARVVGTTITDMLDSGAVGAVTYYHDDEHPFKVEVYSDGTIHSTRTDENTEIKTFTPDPKSLVDTLIPEWGDGSDKVRVTDYVAGDTPAQDRFLSWKWTVPYVHTKEGEEDQPYTYVITYYTAVDTGNEDRVENYIGNTVEEDKAGDTDRASYIFPGDGTYTPITVNKTGELVPGTNGEQTKWTITFNRRSYDLTRTVIEDTLPMLLTEGDPPAVRFMDDYIADSVEVQGLYEQEGEGYEATYAEDSGKLTLIFYRNYNAENPTENLRGLKGKKAGDPYGGVITITFKATNDSGWMKATLQGGASPAHVNNVRLIQNGLDATSKAVVYPKKKDIFKEVEPQPDVISKNGVSQPLYKYTVTVESPEDMFAGGFLDLIDEHSDSLTLVNKDGTPYTEGSIRLTQLLPEPQGTASVPVAALKVTGASGDGGDTAEDGEASEGENGSEGGGESEGGEPVGSSGMEQLRFRISQTDFDEAFPEETRNGVVYTFSYYMMVEEETLKKIAKEKYDADEGNTNVAEAKIDLANRIAVETDVKLRSDPDPVSLDVMPVNKRVDYDKDTEMATYTIILNPRRLTLNNGAPYKMEDAYTGMAVDFESVTVTTEPEERRSEVDWTYHSNTGIFWIPDETKVTLTYKGWPIGDKGQNVEMSNTASVLSYISKGNTKTTLKADHSGTANYYYVNILKYSNDSMTKGLEGAVFQLLTVDENGNKVPVRYQTQYPANSAEEEIVAGYYDRRYPTGDSHRGVEYQAGEDGKTVIAYPGDAVHFVTDSHGLAEILLSRARDGITLQKNVKYFLREMQTPSGHSMEYTDWEFTIGDVDDFDARVYSNGNVLQIANPSTDRGLVVRKNFIDYTAMKTDSSDSLIPYKGFQENVEYTIEGKDAEGKTFFTRTVKYGNFKIVDHKEPDPEDPSKEIVVREYLLVLSKEDLKPGTYTVTEKKADVVGASRMTDVEVTNGEVNGDAATFTVTEDNAQEVDITFTNTYEKVQDETVSVQIEKKWGEKAELLGELSADFGIYRNGELYKTVTLPAAGTQEGDDPWAITVEGLPKTDAAGADIAWSVAEIAATYNTENTQTKTVTGADLEEHFTVTVDGVEVGTEAREVKFTGGSASGIIAFQNELNPLITVTVQKVWEDDETVNHRDDVIYFDLYRTKAKTDEAMAVLTDAESLRALVDDAECVLENVPLRRNADGKWAFSRELLEGYTSSQAGAGDEEETLHSYMYFALEHSVAGYADSYGWAWTTTGETGEDGNTGKDQTITITNTPHQEDDPKGTLNVQKVVTGLDQGINKTFSFTLWNSGKFVQNEHGTLGSDPHVFELKKGENGGYEAVTIQNLPLGTYTLKELSSARIEDYTLSVTIEGTEGKVVDLTGGEAQIIVTAPEEGTGEGAGISAEVTITNAYEKTDIERATTDFRFGKLWVGPDAAKDHETLVWPDGKSISVQVYRRPRGEQRAQNITSIDDTFALTYTVSKSEEGEITASVTKAQGYSDPASAPKLKVSTDNYNHYTFTLEGLPKYNTETGVAWEYYAIEKETAGGSDDVEFAAPSYGYTNGLDASVVDGWSDAAAHETPDPKDLDKVPMVESVINRAIPEKEFEIPVEKKFKLIRGMRTLSANEFEFELYQVDKLGNITVLDTKQNDEDGKTTFKVKPDLTTGLEYHALRKTGNQGANGNYIYEKHPYFEGTYAYYIREIEPTDHKPANDGLTYTSVYAKVDLKVTLDWESGEISTVRTVTYSNGTKDTVETNPVKFTNDYDEGQRKLTLGKLWDDDGNRDGLRGDVKFRVTGTATWTENSVEKSLTQTWPSETDAFVMSVDPKNTDAKTTKEVTVPVFIEGHPVTNYVVTEVECPTSYTIVNDSKTIKNFGDTEDINQNLVPAEIDFTAENKHITEKITSVVFTKTWVDDNNRDNKRPTLKAFLDKLHLMGNGTVGEVTVALSEGILVLSNAGKTIALYEKDKAKTQENVILEAEANDNVYKVTFYKGNFTIINKQGKKSEEKALIQLPKYRDQGEVIGYYVLEDPIEDYEPNLKEDLKGKSSLEEDSKGISSITTENDYNIVLTNTHVEERNVTLTLNKRWDDAQNQDGIRPNRLSGTGDYRNNVILYARSGEDNAATVVYEDGQWKTDDLAQDIRKNATVKLDGNDAKDKNYIVTFNNLPVNRKGNVGETITYMLGEKLDGNSGYILSTVEKETEKETNKAYALTHNSLTIENKHTPATVTVTANKRWEHHGHTLPSGYQYQAKMHLVATLPNDGMEDAGKTFSFNGTDYADKVGDQELHWTNSADSATDQTVTWEHLPKYAPGYEGRLLTYTVEEVFDATIKLPDGYHYVPGENTANDGNFTYHTLNEYQETDISATKVWEDDDNRDNKRKEVTFKLQRSIGGGEYEDVPAYTDTDNEANNYSEGHPLTVSNYAKDSTDEQRTVSWQGLPAWINNQKVTYKVVEVTELQGYTKDEGSAEETAPAVGAYQYAVAETIINTHIIDTTASLNFTKVWEDKGDNRHPSAEEYKKYLHLYAQVKKDPSTLVEVTGDNLKIAPDWKNEDNFKVTQEENGNYTVAISNLPKFMIGKVGVEVEYFIVEDTVNTADNTDPINRYNAAVAGETKITGRTAVGSDGTITNTHKVADLKVSKEFISDLSSDKSKTITFEITSEPPITGTGYQVKYGSSVSANAIDFDEDGKATVTLQLLEGLGEVTIKDLPTDVTYTVEERQEDNVITKSAATKADRLTEANDYTVRIANNDANQTRTAYFENTRVKGDLVVSKTVKSSVQKDRDYGFKFRVTLSDISITKMYDAVVSTPSAADTSGTVSFTNGVSDSIILKNGQGITIKGLPTTVGYKVEEIAEDNAENAYLAKFDRTDAQNGILASSGNAAGFTNTRLTGDLKLKKVLNHAIAIDDGDTFYFNVKLKGDDINSLVIDADNAPITVNGTTLSATTVDPGNEHAMYYSDGTIYNVPVTWHAASGTTTAGGETLISGLPIGTTFEITEPAGVTWTNSGNASSDDVSQMQGNIEKHEGKIVPNPGESIAADTYEVTAINNRKTNDLTIKKTVTSPIVEELTDAYKMEITLNPVPCDRVFIIEGTGLVDKNDDSVDSSKVTFDETGKAVVYVRGKDKNKVEENNGVTIKDIPVDVNYSVQELNNENYATEYNYGTGIIAPTDTHDTYKTVVDNTRKTATIKLEKVVINPLADDIAHKFKFKVRLTTAGKTLVKDQYITVTSGGTQTQLSFGNDTAKPNESDEFELAMNDVAMISGLPINVKYEIVEIVPNGEEMYQSKFDTTWKVSSATETTIETPSPSKALTLTPTEDVSVTCLNTRKTGDLAITKEVHTPFASESNAYYYMKVQLNNIPALPSETAYAVEYPGSGNKETGPKVKFKNGVAVIPVPGNGKQVIVKGLPVDIKYEVFEVTGEESDVEGITVVNGFNPDIFASTSTVTEPTQSGSMVQKGCSVKISNSRKYIPVKVKKTDVTNPIDSALRDAEFTMQWTEADSQKSVALCSGSDGFLALQTEGQGAQGSSMVTFNKDGVIQLANGRYTLIETKAPAGYNMLNGPVNIIVENSNIRYEMPQDNNNIPANGKGINPDNEKKIVTIYVPNNPGVALPATGGPGTRRYTMLGIILTLGAGWLLWRRRRRAIAK